MLQATKGLVLICVDSVSDIWQIVKVECYGLSFYREKERIFEGHKNETIEMYCYLIQ